MTLAEAILGTAILGTLLAGIVVSAARLEGQRGRATRRAEACRLADALLEGWWRDLDEFPRSGSGPAPGHDGWTWRTEVVESETARDLGGEVVALEVRGPDPDAEGGERAVVRVELLLPEKADDEADGSDAG